MEGRSRLLTLGGFCLMVGPLALLGGLWWLRVAEPMTVLGPALLLVYGAFTAAIGGLYIGYDVVTRGRRVGAGLEAMFFMGAGGMVLAIGALPLLGLHLAVYDAPSILSQGMGTTTALASDTARLIEACLILGSILLWVGVATLAASLRDDPAWPSWAPRLVPVLAGAAVGAVFIILVGVYDAPLLFFGATSAGSLASVTLGGLALRAAKQLPATVDASEPETIVLP